MHCPWMLVDSDRSMIAGREVLGFPKKLGDFAFRVDGADVSDAAFDAAAAFRPGARITAKVTRGGVALVEMSGTVSDTPLSDNNTIFPGRRNVSLNAATSHPLPPENPDAPDGACLGNRPRLLQFVFDEIAMDGATWRISDADVSLRETKTDAILRPFPEGCRRRGRGRSPVGGARRVGGRDQLVHRRGGYADARGDHSGGCMWRTMRCIGSDISDERLCTGREQLAVIQVLGTYPIM